MSKPFIPRDRWAKKAAQEGYLARSAFKLKELNKKFRIIKAGDAVLDLGAAPGSWLQVASEAVKPRLAGGQAGGRALGVDKEPIRFKADNVKTLLGDVLDPVLNEQIKPYAPFNVILSDLAPATSGIRDRDQALSLELAERALALARLYLASGGNLIIKIFQSADTKNFLHQVKTMFKTVRVYKPAASRGRSFEIYIVALGKINPAVRERLG